MKKQRPVNLDLSTISFPAPAIASILHRVSGVAMFFALIFVIWAWAYSLQDQQSFDYVKELMTSHFAKIIAWGSISLLTYHIVGGIRHMVMDLGHWEELRSGDISAKLSIALWAVLSVLAGVWLWF